jgi:hypothetical protein
MHTMYSSPFRHYIVTTEGYDAMEARRSRDLKIGC